MKTLAKRIDALDGRGEHYTIAELLDHLDGKPLPVGKSLHPSFPAFLLESAR